MQFVVHFEIILDDIKMKFITLYRGLKFTNSWNRLDLQTSNFQLYFPLEIYMMTIESFTYEWPSQKWTMKIYILNVRQICQ